MNIKKMSKEELELLSHKDITNYLLEDKAMQNTAELFNQIIDLLDLPKSTFDNKIGDYFTSLTTDKRFILLDDGNWDLRSRHTIDKLGKIDLEEDEEDELEEIDDETSTDEENDFDSDISDDDSFDDDDDDLKNLVILDEDELDLEQ